MIFQKNKYRKIKKEKKSGAISIEFALLLPLMLTFYISTASILNVIACYQKVHITARALADMVAQNGTDTITPAAVDDILSAGSLTLWPFDVSQAHLTVSSFTQGSSGGNPIVLWSRGSEPRVKGSSSSTLQNFSTQRPWSFIYAEVKYDDRNIINNFLNIIKPSLLESEIVMTPRNVDTIACPNC